MKKKIIVMVSLIFVIILVVIGIVYANHLAQLNYEKKAQEPVFDDISLEEITNENGLIFRIERNDAATGCDSIFLEVYSEGTYKLTITQITSNEKGRTLICDRVLPGIMCSSAQRQIQSRRMD